MFDKIQNFASHKAGKVMRIVVPILVLCAIVSMIMVFAFADTEADTALTAVIEIILTIFRYIGIVLAIWGVGALVMAFKNEDAESKSRAIMSIIVGIVLILLPTLAKPLINAVLKDTDPVTVAGNISGAKKTN